MTDTPETDKLAQENHIAHPTVWAFCRKFERERDAAIEMMKRTKDNSGQIIASQANENILLTEQRDSLAPSAWTLDWQSGPYPHTMRIVLATDGENIWSATYTKEDGWQDAYSGEPVDYYITYWCEVPELPQS